MIRRNHAYQKLFPFTIARPNLLLSLLLLRTNDRYVVKLPTSDSFPHPRLVVQYDVKLHILNPSQLDHSLLRTPLSLVPPHIHRRHRRYATQGHVPRPADVPV